MTANTPPDMERPSAVGHRAAEREPSEPIGWIVVPELIYQKADAHLRNELLGLAGLREADGERAAR